MSNVPRVGERWIHFKGTVYSIVDMVKFAEGDELELLIIYQHGSDRYARRFTNFIEHVERESYSGPRFVLHESPTYSARLDPRGS